MTTSCCAPSAADDFGRILLSVAPLALVIIGWGIVNLQNNRRELRKEVRQLTDRFIKAVADTVQLVMEYHAANADGADPAQLSAWKINLAFSSLSAHLKLLHQVRLETAECSGPFIALKSIATGDDFMTKHSKPWNQDDERWMKLLEYSARLTRAVELAYFSCYQ